MMQKYIKDLVSVIIPTYHNCDRLPRAIDSVLNQTYKNLEVIVVNDNNNDDDYTKMLIEKTKKYNTENRFKLVFQEKHINGAAARNYGVKQSKGEYIAFLDDDDWWNEKKIEEQLNFIKAKNDRESNRFAVVSTLVEFHGDNGYVRKPEAYKDGKIVVEILSREIDVTTCSVMIRHEAFDNIGGFDEKLKRHQEIQMLSRLVDKYELCLLPMYLTYVDITGSRNIPDYKATCVIKKELFNSVADIISKLTVKDRDKIIGSHEFELAYIALREHKILNFLKHIFNVLKSYHAIKISINRFLSRLMKK